MVFFYSQTEGLGMGNPLSPLLFEVFICTIMNKNPSVYINFLIDLDMWIILVPSNTDFSSLLLLVNSVDHCIQFTLKVENDNYFPFLAVLVSKDIDGSQRLSSENHSQSLSLLMLFPIFLLNRKWLPFILTSIVLYIFALILPISPMNLIT